MMLIDVQQVSAGHAIHRLAFWNNNTEGTLPTTIKGTTLFMTN